MPMKLRTEEAWKKALRRVCHNGPPLSWKTSMMMTYPQPIGYVCMPGEQGHSSVSQEEGIIPFVWEDESDKLKVNYANQIKEVKGVITSLIAGEHGQIQTLALDGVHKLYDAFLGRACGGELITTIDERSRGGKYHQAGLEFWQWLGTILLSNVPYICVSVWDGPEKTDDTDMSPKAEKAYYPDLAGRSAKKIIGEFGLSLHHEFDDIEGVILRTKANEKIRGAGTHIPIDVRKRIPDVIKPRKCEAGYKRLEWAQIEEAVFGGAW